MIKTVLEEFQSANTNANETLRQLRQQGSDVFQRLGLPHSKVEDWKYTDVSVLNKTGYQLPDETPVDNPESDAAIDGLDGFRLVFQNNVFQSHLSNLDELPDNVQVSWVEEPDGDSLQGVGSVVDLEQHRLAALNQALVSRILTVRVTRSATLEKPIYLLWVSQPEQQPVMMNPRILIELEPNAKATVIEHYVETRSTSNLTNVVTEVRLQANAHLEHYRLQEQNLYSHHIAGLHANLERDSSLTSHNIDVGGKLVRNDLVANLDGPGASVVLNGFCFAGPGQHIDNHTRINHLKPHTTSLEDYRGVIDAGGRSVFNGKVVVSQDAQKIEANQSNNNLLLADGAEVDTKPELEIYADDVKCSHGATIGQLDKDALFYLRSRGIGTTVARTLLTFAFAESVISRLGLEPVQKRMQEAVIGRLPNHERIEEFL